MLTDHQVRKLRRLDRLALPKELAALRAGMDPKTARKYRSPGSGKLKVAGGISGPMKESIQRASLKGKGVSELPTVDREKELSLGAFGLREPSGVLIVVEREE